MGTQVAEVPEITGAHLWRYVDSARNPADDLARGKTLIDIAGGAKDHPSFSRIQRVGLLIQAPTRKTISQNYRSQLSVAQLQQRMEVLPQ